MYIYIYVQIHENSDKLMIFPNLERFCISVKIERTWPASQVYTSCDVSRLDGLDPLDQGFDLDHREGTCSSQMQMQNV